MKALGFWAALLLASSSYAQASGESQAAPNVLGGGLAIGVYEMMSESAESKQDPNRRDSFVTCLIIKEHNRVRMSCMSTSSQRMILGEPARQIFSHFPKRTEGHDGMGGIYRGGRVSCLKQADSMAVECLLPQ